MDVTRLVAPILAAGGHGWRMLGAWNRSEAIPSEDTTVTHECG